MINAKLKLKDIDNHNIRFIFEKIDPKPFGYRSGITILPADPPTQGRLGWVVYETIGACVINDYAIGKISCEKSN